MSHTEKSVILSQPAIICAVLEEIARKKPAIAINSDQLQAIISAANQVTAAFKTSHKVATSND